uniref:cytochrome b n=1 Tax=Bipalium admarginatum TaxID=3023024 RepID=UPI002410BFAE|nr:cytochrome b [Bipalium admarginatum]WEM34736.1 cytochrome b [Bipalium admarginatum]
MNNFFVFRINDSVGRLINDLVIDLPSPKNISFFWNFGSLLGLFLGVQIVSGLFLSFSYVSSIELAFSSVDLLVRDVFFGFFIRSLHSNGATFFFCCLYIHIFRGLYYKSYLFNKVWLVGCIIFVLSMAVAFLGYVLPWGQMSFWGATVITNLFSAVPYIGNDIVIWLWGGFSVSFPTLVRFFSLHFLLPFVIAFFVVFHIFFLHETGSNNPLGIDSSLSKINFHPYFSFQDAIGFIFIIIIFSCICFGFPFLFLDSENFIEANVLVTPPHIQPEWYFLPAYTILRAVPNKLGGVLALVMFVLVYFFIPVFSMREFIGSSVFFRIMFFFWIFNFFLLMWLGACSVVYPYIGLGRVCSFIYFFIFFFF